MDIWSYSLAQKLEEQYMRWLQTYQRSFSQKRLNFFSLSTPKSKSKESYSKEQASFCKMLLKVISSGKHPLLWMNWVCTLQGWSKLHIAKPWILIRYIWFFGLVFLLLSPPLLPPLLFILLIFLLFFLPFSFSPSSLFKFFLR